MVLDFSILIKSHKYSNQNIIQNQINKITQHKVKLSLRKELLIWSCEDSESSGVLALGLGLELPDLGPTGSWAYYSKEPKEIGFGQLGQSPNPFLFISFFFFYFSSFPFHTQGVMHGTQGALTILPIGLYVDSLTTGLSLAFSFFSS